jgi:RNA polymerase-binding transcription factor DksA
LNDAGIPLTITGEPEVVPEAPSAEAVTPERDPRIIRGEEPDGIRQIADLADALATERGEEPAATPEPDVTPEPEAAPEAERPAKPEDIGPTGSIKLNPQYRPRRAEGGEEAVGPTGARFTRDPGEWYLDPDNPGTEAEAAAFLSEIENLLREKRIANGRRLENARADLEDVAAARGTALSTDEEGGGDSSAFDIEQARSVIRGLEGEQREIDEALRRIYDGTYGTSEGLIQSSVGITYEDLATPTGLPIPAERLLAFPTARHRVGEIEPNRLVVRPPQENAPSGSRTRSSAQPEQARPATTPRARSRRGEGEQQPPRPATEAEDQLAEQQEALGTGSRTVVSEEEQRRNEEAIAEFEASRAERQARSAARRRSRMGGRSTDESGTPRIGPVRPALTLDRDGTEQVESNFINYRKPFNVNNEYESPALDRVFEMLPSLDPNAYDTELLAGSAVARAVKEFFADTMNAETGGNAEKEWDNDYSLGRLYSYIQDMLNVESTDDRRAEAQRIVDGVDAIIARMQTGAQ